MAKVTRATLKSFIKNNIDNLYIKVNSKFNGMVDCVMPVDEKEYSVAKKTESSLYNTLGINGDKNRKWILRGLWSL